MTHIKDTHNKLHFITNKCSIVIDELLKFLHKCEKTHRTTQQEFINKFCSKFECFEDCMLPYFTQTSKELDLIVEVKDDKETIIKISIHIDEEGCVFFDKIYIHTLCKNNLDCFYINAYEKEEIDIDEIIGKSVCKFIGITAIVLAIIAVTILSIKKLL